jgi:hypothetical protein
MADSEQAKAPKNRDKIPSPFFLVPRFVPSSPFLVFGANYYKKGRLTLMRKYCLAVGMYASKVTETKIANLRCVWVVLLIITKKIMTELFNIKTRSISIWKELIEKYRMFHFSFIVIQIPLQI